MAIHQKHPHEPAASAPIHLTQARHNGAVERIVDPSKLWAIIQKNWMVLKGDKVRLFPLLFMPLLMIVIFGYAAGNLPKHLPTAVADYDQTGFSHLVSDQISGLDFFAVNYRVGTQDEGKRLLDEGRIKVLFVLPQGLSDRVMRGEAAQIQIMVDESDSSVAQSAKAAAQAFSQSLSRQVLASRLQAISASADSAAGSLDRSKSVLSPIAAHDARPALESSRKTADEARHLSSASSSQLADSIQNLQNSLGYLIDQNEVADSFNPTSMGNAALVQLATGDSQASTLQQVAFYKALMGTQALLLTDTLKLASVAQSSAGLLQSHAAQADMAISLEDSAGRQLALIRQTARTADNPITLDILQPYGYDRRAIDFLLPAILALVIFQGATMNLGRAIAGERQDGSLTRVFLTPTSNITIILGTQIFYLLLETIRSSALIFVAILLFGVSISGFIPDIIFIIALFSLGATGVGMVLSVIAKNQDQYMALAMLISMPMIFLSGAFFPIQTMPALLQSVAQVLPVTYAADALRGVMVKGFGLTQVVPDLLALTAFGVFTFSLSLLLFKRELV